MPTLGLPELLLIVVILVLVFGVGKLGDMGKALGRGIREFRQEVGPNSNTNTTTTTTTRTELPGNSGVERVEIVEERERDRV